MTYIKIAHSRVYDIEERIKTPKKFRFPTFEAVNWLAAQKLQSDLSDLNSDSTLCPAHLLGGIKSLVTTLKAWLAEQRPCEVFNGMVDPAKLVRELSKEVRLAERIQVRTFHRILAFCIALEELNKGSENPGSRSF